MTMKIIYLSFGGVNDCLFTGISCCPPNDVISCSSQAFFHPWYRFCDKFEIFHGEGILSFISGSRLVILHCMAEIKWLHGLKCPLDMHYTIA